MSTKEEKINSCTELGDTIDLISNILDTIDIISYKCNTMLPKEVGTRMVIPPITKRDLNFIYTYVRRLYVFLNQVTIDNSNDCIEIVNAISTNKMAIDSLLSNLYNNCCNIRLYCITCNDVYEDYDRLAFWLRSINDTIIDILNNMRMIQHSGSPIREYSDTRIVGVKDPRTGVVYYNDAFDATGATNEENISESIEQETFAFVEASDGQQDENDDITELKVIPIESNSHSNTPIDVTWVLRYGKRHFSDPLEEGYPGLYYPDTKINDEKSTDSNNTDDSQEIPDDSDDYLYVINDVLEEEIKTTENLDDEVDRLDLMEPEESITDDSEFGGNIDRDEARPTQPESIDLGTFTIRNPVNLEE